MEKRPSEAKAVKVLGSAMSIERTVARMLVLSVEREVEERSEALMVCTEVVFGNRVVAMRGAERRPSVRAAMAWLLVGGRGVGLVELDCGVEWVS